MQWTLRAELLNIFCLTTNNFLLNVHFLSTIYSACLISAKQPILHIQTILMLNYMVRTICML